MRMTAIALLTLFAVPAAAQEDDAEAKKKRLGKILNEMSELQEEAKKLLEELTGGDRTKMGKIMTEVAKKYAPKAAAEMVSAQKSSNERNASTTLKTFASAQADFRANDRDGNRVNDFWSADVSGLYRIDRGGAIKLIERSAASADARPVVPLGKEGTLPGAKDLDATKFVSLGPSSSKAGYSFTVIKKYQDRDGTSKKYDMGNGRNYARFGICAYPAEYPKNGTRTFIINEENTVFWKDTKGKPPQVFPLDPRKEGWKKLY